MPIDARPSRLRLADVARALGVSVATVSNAFNRPDQLSPALRKLVLERAEELGYRGPGIEGRLLRTGHAGAIALYIPEPMTYLLEDAFVRTFMGALMNACQERQIGLLLLPAVPHEKSERPRPPAALDVAAVDAIIFYGLAGDDPVIQRALERGRPVIGIDMPDREGVIGIGVDDVGGARAAARHLIKKGHRRIGIISLPTSRRRADRMGTPTDFDTASIRFPKERWRGYAEAFEEAEIDPATVPIRICKVNTQESGRAAMDALLDQNLDRPTAVLAMSDVVARGAMDACRERGLSVPQDIAIVGFDDAPFAKDTGLTTVAQDAGEKALIAVRCALGETVETTVVSTTVMERSTS
ncbi:LacI family DNA-binding transcriptional regulator [uncultured Roseobacter sp.]|uniref:LacI family DNA-binding transcriptional regulator n=1 Tax=uncultured Roseobacter sp. TaxID=114847 RepID=UPI0026309531|nr:LacI family DNA-binding transcriptional regulator [uncultured Roseobacter sp.]